MWIMILDVSISIIDEKFKFKVTGSQLVDVASYGRCDHTMSEWLDNGMDITQKFYEQNIKCY